MRYLFLILLVIPFSVQSQQEFKRENIAVIHLDTSKYWAYPLRGNQPFALTEKDIIKADSIVGTCIKDRANDSGGFLIGYNIGRHDFIKQMVPSVNEKGEVIVWANCFADYMEMFCPDWESQIVIIHDGGADGGIFNVVVNLSTGTYTSLYVNGL